MYKVSNNIYGMAKEPSRGVFWVADDRLLAYPFYGGVGTSKSGLTYNHKKLWNDIKPLGSKKPFNYYPRGRVDFSNKGNPIIYLNPNIDDDELIGAICIAFGLRSTPEIRYDYSEHYKCYLDDGWKPER